MGSTCSLCVQGDDVYTSSLATLTGGGGGGKDAGGAPMTPEEQAQRRELQAAAAQKRAAQFQQVRDVFHVSIIIPMPLFFLSLLLRLLYVGNIILLCLYVVRAVAARRCVRSRRSWRTRSASSGRGAGEESPRCSGSLGRCMHS